MTEYKIATGWRIFICIVAPFMIALFGYLLIMPFQQSADMPGWAPWLFVPVSLAMMAVFVLGSIDTFMGKFTIAEDRVHLRSVTGNRLLLFQEIKGYRTNDKFITIEASVPGKKNITINQYFAGTREIVHWLAIHYPDLGFEDARQEHERILDDDTYGWIPETRIVRLINARRITRVLNWAGCIAAAWIMFYPQPYTFAVFVNIAMTLISVAAVKLSHGLIRADEKNTSVHPSLFLGIAAPGFALGLRAILDFNVFDHAPVWMLLIPIACSLFLLLMIGNREFNFRKAHDWVAVAGLLLVLCFYTYGVVVSLNSLLDTSNPKIFHATVVSKRADDDKIATYYFTLTPWGPQKGTDEVSVTSGLYNAVTTGEEVQVLFRKGWLDVPWLVVTK